MNRILLIAGLLITLAFTVDAADRRRLLMARNTAAAAAADPLPLELNSTAAAWSYGVARKTTNAWGGGLAWLVRSSDGATNALLSSGTSNNILSLSGWYGSDNVYVTNVWDQTGNGRHLVVGATNTSFLIVTSGVPIFVNGKSVLRRVTTTSAMNGTATLSLPISMMFLVYSDSKTAADIFVNGGSTTRTSVKQATGATYRLSSGSNLDSETLTLDQWDVVRAKFITGTDYIGVDYNALASGTAGDNSITLLQLGSGTVSADSYIGEWHGWPEDSDDATKLLPIATNMVNFYLGGTP